MVIRIQPTMTVSIFKYVFVVMAASSIPVTSSKKIKGELEFYSIPIPFPPKIAEILSGVNLSYSKVDGHHGIAGYRWHLNGLPKISRCGISPALSWQYCLNGNPLSIVSGTYGSDKSTYRLIADEYYQQVLARGSKGSNPTFFEVITKDSKTMLFGFNDDSRIAGENQLAVHSWLLDTVKDNEGRTVMLNYDANSTFKYLRSVTGNNATVEFYYTDRHDVMTRYFNGSLLYKLDKVLDRIKFYSCKNCAYKELRLGYSDCGSSRLNLLTNLVLCVDNDYCHSQVKFTYKNLVDLIGPNAMSKPSIWIKAFGTDAGGWSYKYPRLVVDINGDGFKDIVGFALQDVLTAVYSNSSPIGFVGYASVNQDIVYKSGFRVDKHERLVIDLTGDGLADFIAFENKDVIALTNNGPRGAANFTFSSFRIWTPEFGYHNGFGKTRPKFVKDVNNDGLPDIFCFGSSFVLFALNNGTGFERARAVSNQMTYNSGWRVEKTLRFLEDINGDQLPDMVGFAEDGVYVSVNIDGKNFQDPEKWSSEFGYSVSAGGWRIGPHIRLIIDVNGDGLADIVGFAYAGVMVSLNTGAGFTASENWHVGFGYIAGNWKPHYQRKLVDMNGDGLPDVVGFGCCGVRVALNTGFSFANATDWSTEYGWENGWTLDFPKVIEDINQDGTADVIGFAKEGVLVSLNNNRPLSLIGIEGSIRLEYDDHNINRTKPLEPKKAGGISEPLFGGVVGSLGLVSLGLVVAVILLVIRLRRSVAHERILAGHANGTARANPAFDPQEDNSGRGRVAEASLYESPSPASHNGDKQVYADLNVADTPGSEYMNVR